MTSTMIQEMDHAHSEQMQIGHKALISSITEGDLQTTKDLLENKEPRLIELRDLYGNTPMHIAIQQQQELYQQRHAILQGCIINDGDDDYDYEEEKEREREQRDKEYEELKIKLSKSVEILDYFITEYSHVLVKSDGLNRTPLHAAVSSHTPNASIVKLLIRHGPSSVIAMADGGGSTPLHLALCWEISPYLIQMMVKSPAYDDQGQASDDNNKRENYSNQAIHVMDDNDRTVFHEACHYQHVGKSEHDFSFYQTLLNEWPTSCLVLDEYGKSPYDDAIRNLASIAPATEQFVGTATKDVVCAMIEAFYSCYDPQRHQSLTSCFMKSILCHVQSTMALVIPSKDISLLKSTTNISLLLFERFRPHMSQVLLKRLIDLPELQVIFKGKDTGIDDSEQDDDGENDNADNDDFAHRRLLRYLIHDLYRMNTAGRNDYLRNDPGNKAAGIQVLSSVSNSCSGLYWHLRENPSLCDVRKEYFK